MAAENFCSLGSTGLQTLGSAKANLLITKEHPRPTDSVLCPCLLLLRPNGLNHVSFRFPFKQINRWVYLLESHPLFPLFGNPTKPVHSQTPLPIAPASL